MSELDQLYVKMDIGVFKMFFQPLALKQFIELDIGAKC